MDYLANCDDNSIRAFNADRSTAIFDSLLGIFDLKNATVGRIGSHGIIVPRSCGTHDEICSFVIDLSI